MLNHGLNFLYMKALGIAVMLILTVAAGLAASQWFNNTKHQPLNDGLAATTTNSLELAGLSTTSTVVTSSTSAWFTYTDPKWHYSIQYPSDFGAAIASYSADDPFATNSAEDFLDLTWPSDAADSLEVEIAPVVTSTRVALAQIPGLSGFKTQPSILVDGFIATSSIDSFGNEMIIVNSTPTPYELIFTLFGDNGPYYQALPPVWKRMLASFRVSTVNP
jgi:hypothetical protein